MKTRILTLGLSFAMTFAFAQEMKTFTKDNYTMDYDSTWEISEQKIQPAIQLSLIHI